MIVHGKLKAIHLQLEENLLKRIQKNGSKPGVFFGSEVEIAREFGVSRSTVRNVTDRLVVMGVLTRAPGKGLFVALPVMRESVNLLVGFGEKMRAAGLTIRTRLITNTLVEVTDNVAKALEISESTKVLRIERVRYLHEIPFALHVAYLPQTYGDQLKFHDLETESLTGILQELLGQAFAYARESIGARAATNEEAKTLDVSSGFPVLIVQGATYVISGEAIRYTESIYRSDLVRLDSFHTHSEVKNA